MKNFEKYKTAKERTKAFERLCTLLTDCEKCPCYKQSPCYKQKGYSKCEFIWLDLEAEEEKPLPCPFCGKSTRIATWNLQHWQAVCDSCGYCSSQHYMSQENAVAAHNRVAKAVMDAKAKEANDEEAK